MVEVMIKAAKTGTQVYPMNKIPKKLKRLLAEQADRAWEAEMRSALAALAERFDQWRAGALSCDELDQAVHAYHNGIARDIWKRYAGNDPVLPVARAVALGILGRESVPPEVLAQIAGLVDLFSRGADDDDEEGDA